LFKTTGFREILKNALKICEDNYFSRQKVGRSRGNKDGNFNDSKYLMKYNKICERFINYIMNLI
jgi:hypothetical protein